ncbi:MAG: glycerol-3-phosphate 1-O-acyltransferase PlsY [Bacteroidota bacterium]|nr:glycerol-3-phosphate 1-O-acyltransferase PlsY [Bacteroidota bacterium]
MFIFIISGLFAYLFGAFNAAYWFGKWFHQIDIRQHGSKNAGATNLLRVVGWKTALPAFLFDAAKSFAAVKLAYFQNSFEPQSEAFVIWQISLGVIAVFGHIFPVFSGFKGGKGVASLLGMIIALHPLAALSAFGIFVISLVITRIVSISSMLAGISFPIIFYLLFYENQNSLLIFSLFAALLLLISHKKNIKRLLNGEEKHISFKS